MIWGFWIAVWGHDLGFRIGVLDWGFGLGFVVLVWGFGLGFRVRVLIRGAGVGLQGLGFWSRVAVLFARALIITKEVI